MEFNNAEKKEVDFSVVLALVMLYTKGAKDRHYLSEIVSPIVKTLAISQDLETNPVLVLNLLVLLAFNHYDRSTRQSRERKRVKVVKKVLETML